MKTVLGISLYSYLCLKLAITLFLSYYLLCFLYDKIREQEGGTVSSLKGCGELAQNIYRNVSKCKNDKILKNN
jgi:hypothetical protein